MLAGCSSGSSTLPAQGNAPGTLRSISSENGDQSANGAGQFTPQGGELRTFSFSAVKHADGTVDGQADVDSRVSDHRFHYVLDCLHILNNGNTAYLSGKVTESNLPAVHVGDHAWFAVKQGSPDQITLVATGTVPNCLTNLGLTFHAIDGGSINIHT